MINQLELVDIANELAMDKHHGIIIDDIILILLLFSSYGVRSISQLDEKARNDTALAAIITDIKEVNNKVLLYFQGCNEQIQLEQFLDRIVLGTQKDRLFKSRKDGVIPIDDSNLEKTGKKMENIEIIYNHGTNQYALGFVIVVVSYADSEKAYPVNFEFRLRSKEEKAEAKLQAEKKKEKIDFRKKDGLLKMINLNEKNGNPPTRVEVNGVNLNKETVTALDKKKISWMGIPNSKTKLLDPKNNYWNFSTLKEKTRKKRPIEVQLEGWQIYIKKVIFPEYGSVDFTIVTDMDGNEIGIFLFKHISISSKTEHIQKYLMRQQVADSNKLKIALGGVKRAKESGIKAETCVGDAWFLVAWFVNALQKINEIKRFVSRVKSNCEICYKGEWLKANLLWEKISFRRPIGKFQNVGSAIVLIKGFNNPVKLVFLQELDKYFKVKAQYILFCTDSNWSCKKIIQAYKLRWSIECFFRTAKQSYGLQDFHHRKFIKIFCHVTFVFISYLLSTKLKVCNPKLTKLTMGQIINRFLNCLIILERQKGELVVYFDPVFEKEFGIPFSTE